MIIFIETLTIFFYQCKHRFSRLLVPPKMRNARRGFPCRGTSRSFNDRRSIRARSSSRAVQFRGVPRDSPITGGRARVLPYGRICRSSTRTTTTGDSFARIVFVTRIFTMCPEQIGVAPLSRTLASRTLVMPRSCLVNNCLIFSPSLLGALPLAPSYVLIHSFASLFRGPGGLGLYERLKNRSNCALVLRDDKCRKRARARSAEGSGENYCRNRWNERHA